MYAFDVDEAKSTLFVILYHLNVYYYYYYYYDDVI